jgi:hypothetical protein
MSLEWLVIKNVFVSVGNNPNSEIVAKADLTAVREGLVVVDEFLRVSNVLNSPSPKATICWWLCQ